MATLVFFKKKAKLPGPGLLLTLTTLMSDHMGAVVRTFAQYEGPKFIYWARVTNVGHVIGQDGKLL
jgi:hypothetical protein